MAGELGARQVGEIMNMGRRRMIRSMKSPLDKCTIISIYPKDINEVKYTIEPGKFLIPAGSYDKPGMLVVGPSSWWKDIDYDQPLLEIPHSSVQIADSVIRDYSAGLLGCDMSAAMPGLFFVLGETTSLEIKVRYKDKLDEVAAKQKNWYQILVKLGDSLWARSNGNPLCIADDMRLAARELNLNDKEWLKDFQMSEMIRCSACGAMRNPLFPVCAVCKSVDQSHPAAKDLKFAV